MGTEEVTVDQLHARRETLLGRIEEARALLPDSGPLVGSLEFQVEQIEAEIQWRQEVPDANA